MKLGGHRLVRRSIFLAAACLLALVLTACTGKGGGYLPPDGVVFTGQAAFGFTFSCEKGDLKIELAYNDKGKSLNMLGSPFGIHGIVDEISPLDESEVCIGQNPPPPDQPLGQLIFLGRFYLTSSAPSGFPPSCPKKETSTTPLCRFEVIVQNNDQSLPPSAVDSFSIKLSSVTSIYSDNPDDCPPGGTPPCVITEFPAETVFYARAGLLAGGNITVK
jgi:predicted small lipoprotein YifL